VASDYPALDAGRLREISQMGDVQMQMGLAILQALAFGRQFFDRGLSLRSGGFSTTLFFPPVRLVEG